MTYAFADVLEDQLLPSDDMLAFVPGNVSLPKDNIMLLHEMDQQFEDIFMYDTESPSLIAQQAEKSSHHFIH